MTKAVVWEVGRIEKLEYGRRADRAGLCALCEGKENVIVLLKRGFAQGADDRLQELAHAFGGDNRHGQIIHICVGLTDDLAQRLPLLTEPVVSLYETRLTTIPFSKGPQYGYDPLPAILSGRKQHTLRRQGRKPGLYEVSVDGRRRGVIVRLTAVDDIQPEQYLTDEFAWADGFDGGDDIPPGEALKCALEDMYGDDEYGRDMKLWWFRVEWTKQKGEWVRYE